MFREFSCKRTRRADALGEQASMKFLGIQRSLPHFRLNEVTATTLSVGAEPRRHRQHCHPAILLNTVIQRFSAVSLGPALFHFLLVVEDFMNAEIRLFTSVAHWIPNPAGAIAASLGVYAPNACPFTIRIRT